MRSEVCSGTICKRRSINSEVWLLRPETVSALKGRLFCLVVVHTSHFDLVRRAWMESRVGVGVRAQLIKRAGQGDLLLDIQLDLRGFRLVLGARGLGSLHPVPPKDDGVRALWQSEGAMTFGIFGQPLPWCPQNHWHL